MKQGDDSRYTPAALELLARTRKIPSQHPMRKDGPRYEEHGKVRLAKPAYNSNPLQNVDSDITDIFKEAQERYYTAVEKDAQHTPQRCFIFYQPETETKSPLQALKDSVISFFTSGEFKYEKD